MFDEPDGKAILREVQAALKAGIAPGFQQAVAANAVALALREEELAAGAAAREAMRLEAILGRAGTLDQLNAALALGLRDGAIAPERPDVQAHLIQTTIDKIAVDQPNYPAYRNWRSQKDAG